MWHHTVVCLPDSTTFCTDPTLPSVLPYHPVLTLQLFNLVSTLELPIARWWWLLPSRDSETSCGGLNYAVQERAEMLTRPYDAPPFQPRSDSSRAQQRVRGVGSKRQLSGAAESDSSGDEAAAAAGLKQKRLIDEFACSTSKYQDGGNLLVLTGYNSSEDEACLAAAEAAWDAAEKAHSAVLADSDSPEEGDTAAADPEVWQERAVRKQNKLRRLQSEFEKHVRKCRQLLLVPPHTEQWRQMCEGSVRRRPLHSDTTSTCSYSSPSSSGDEGGSATDATQGRSSRLLSTAAIAGFRTEAQRQQRQAERGLRKLRKEAVRYTWGTWRPWHVQRTKALIQRQLQLHRVTQLQWNVNRVWTKWAYSSSSSSHSEVPPLQQQQQQVPPLLRFTAAAAELLGAGDTSEGLILVTLQQEHSAAEPHAARCGWQYVAAPPLQHMQCTAVETASGKAVAVDLRQQVRELKGSQLWLSTWQGEAVAAAADRHPAVAEAGATLRFEAALEQQQQQGEGGGSMRQLLWQLLTHMKPAACLWYQHGASHHSQQQQQQRKHVGSSKRLAAAAAAASAASAAVHECTSAALWSTLTRSLASDLLLVPPSIRDLVGNGLAAGAGRLGAGGDANGSGIDSSSSNSVAARMLVVQCARAARLLYVQVRGSARDLKVRGRPAAQTCSRVCHASVHMYFLLSCWSAQACCSLGILQQQCKRVPTFHLPPPHCAASTSLRPAHPL
jgi:hypothetical protein